MAAAWLTTRVSADTARRLTGPVSEYLLLTLAAQLTTFPLIVYHFGRISLVSLPVNVAILPAQPPVMTIGGLAVVLGAIFQPAGQALAFLVWPFLAYSIRVVEWFAGWDAAVRTVGQVDVWLVLFYYLILFGLTLYWQPFWEGLKRNLKPAMLLAGLAAATLLVWPAALSGPDGMLHVTVLDVGEGEAVLIETPGGRYALIGGGQSPSQLADGLGRTLPLFHRQLDVLVVAGTGKDQLAALPTVLPRYIPSQVWWAGEVEASRPARQVYAWLQQEGLPVQTILTGQALDLGDGAEMQVLSVTDEGAVLLVRWHVFRVLLPIGGIEGTLGAPEVTIRTRGLTAVLLPHGGREGYLTADWLALAHPSLVLASVDALNLRGLPDPATLDLLAGYPLYRTDLHGSIELVTDGRQLWIYTEEQPASP